MTRTCAWLLIVVLGAPGVPSAQVPSDVWRTFAQQIEVGTEVTVRLRDGQRVRAVLVGARDDVLLLQPKTRLTVPVQAVPYDAIVAIERRQAGGMGAGKVAAIGVASGVGAFFAMLLILAASFD